MDKINIFKNILLYFLNMYSDFFIFIIILFIILSLLTSLGLFLINKKQWNKLAMILSWIPLLKLYSYTKIANVSLFRYIIIPVITLFILLFLINFLHLSEVNETLTAILYLAWILYLYINWIIVLNKISKNTWNDKITTIWLFLFPIIFLPIVWILYIKNKTISKKFSIPFLLIFIFVPIIIFLYNSYYKINKINIENKSIIEKSNWNIKLNENKKLVFKEYYDKSIGDEEIKLSINFEWIKTLSWITIDKIDFSKYWITNSENPNVDILLDEKILNNNLTDIELLNSDINKIEIINFGVLKEDYSNYLWNNILRRYKIPGMNKIELSIETTIISFFIDIIEEKYFNINIENYNKIIKEIKLHKKYNLLKYLFSKKIWENLNDLKNEEKIIKIINDILDDLYLKDNSINVKVDFTLINKINWINIDNIDFSNYEIFISDNNIKPYSSSWITLASKKDELQRVFFLNWSWNIIFAWLKLPLQKDLFLSYETTSIILALNGYGFELDFSKYNDFINKLLKDERFIKNLDSLKNIIEWERNFFDGVDFEYEFSFSKREFWEPYKFLLNYFK